MLRNPLPELDPASVPTPRSRKHASGGGDPGVTNPYIPRLKGSLGSSAPGELPPELRLPAADDTPRGGATTSRHATSLSSTPRSPLKTERGQRKRLERLTDSYQTAVSKETLLSEQYEKEIGHVRATPRPVGSPGGLATPHAALPSRAGERAARPPLQAGSGLVRPHDARGPGPDARALEAREALPRLRVAPQRAGDVQRASRRRDRRAAQAECAAPAGDEARRGADEEAVGRDADAQAGDDEGARRARAHRRAAEPHPRGARPGADPLRRHGGGDAAAERAARRREPAGDAHAGEGDGGGEDAAVRQDAAEPRAEGAAGGAVRLPAQPAGRQPQRLSNRRTRPPPLPMV